MAYTVTINSSQSTNAAGNQSTVYVSLTLTAINQGYSGYNTSLVLYVGGNLVANVGGPSALNTDGAGTESWTSGTYSYTFTHDYNTGTRGAVGTSGTFYGGGGYSPPSGGISASGATYGAIDYDRSPTTPSYTGITRSADFTYFTNTYTGGVNNNGPTPTYTLQYSTNSSSWTTYTLDANNRVYLSSSSQYYFKVIASNPDGTKESSVSGPYYGIPSAPSSITATRTKRDITVTAGNSTADGGTAITAYKVQYSSDDGASWRTAQTMTSQSYTYSGLSASSTYLFRVFSTNASGSSTFTQTPSGTYMPVGGKRWNGTTFINPPKAQRWSGSTWIDLQTAKKWDGSSWIDLA